MSNFIDDESSLAAAKTGPNPSGSATRYIRARDWNEVRQALLDIQTKLTTTALTRIKASDSRIGLVGVAKGSTPPDESAAFLRAAALMRAHRGLGLELDGDRAYGFSNRDWSQAVPWLSIYGHGAELWDVKASAANPWFTNQGLIVDSNANGFLINTVDAFSLTVQLKTAGDYSTAATQLTAGMPVLIDSFLIQNGGGPPGAGYRDYNFVKSYNASTGLVTLRDPLKESHRSDQYDQVGGSGERCGAARIRPLIRASDGFRVGERLYLEELVIMDNPNHPDTGNNGPSGLGTLYTTGFLYAELKRVMCGNWVPSTCRDVRAIECDTYFTEIDKVGNTCHMIGGRHGSITGGSGYDVVRLDGCEIHDELALEVPVAECMNLRIMCPDDPGSYTSQVSINANHATWVNCRSVSRSGDIGAAIVVSIAEQTLPALTAVSGNTVEFTRAGTTWFGAELLRKGVKIYYGTEDGPRGIVKDIYDNAGTGKRVIEVWQWNGGAPSVGNTLKYKPLKTHNFVPEIVREQGNPGRQQADVSFPYNSQTITRPSVFKPGRVGISIPNDTASHILSPNGRLLRVVAMITKAQAGKTLNISLRRADPGAWIANHTYATGDEVSNDTGKVYYCTAGGMSAGSGGPTGTGTGIADNAATWDYVGVVNTLCYMSIDCSLVRTVTIDFDRTTLTPNVSLPNDGMAGQYNSALPQHGTGLAYMSEDIYLSMGGTPTALAGEFWIEYLPIGVG